jgi:hypothetical protein
MISINPTVPERLWGHTASLKQDVTGATGG